MLIGALRRDQLFRLTCVRATRSASELKSLARQARAAKSCRQAPSGVRSQATGGACQSRANTS